MMEDRSYIRERHGIANARTITVASVQASDSQSVLITDSFGEVQLALSTSSYPAGLTPEQARLIAIQLNNSADRVENSGVDS